MSTGKVTKRSVDALEAKERAELLWDSELTGFGVRAMPGGSKSYIFQYRMGGREAKTRRYTIGRHGSPWTAERARKEAERVSMLVRQGTDPVAATKLRRKESVELAFSAYVGTFVDGYLKLRWKQWQLGQGMLLREAVPVLASKPLPLITRADISPIWDRLRDRPAVARLTHATLRKLFRWAVSRGDLERSPLEGVEAPPPVPSRDRVLTDAEIRLVWTAAGDLGTSLASFYRLLILTGQRRDEVASADWSELNRGHAIWVLPAARTKNRMPHAVPLSHMALVAFDAVAGSENWPARGLVFSNNNRTPFSGFSKVKARIDALMLREVQMADPSAQLEPWRLHDLRRTLATGLQRLGVRFEVTEAVLSHISGARSGVAGVYQRHDWKEEKRVALDSWAMYVESLLHVPTPTAASITSATHNNTLKSSPVPGADATLPRELGSPT